MMCGVLFDLENLEKLFEEMGMNFEFVLFKGMNFY